MTISNLIQCLENKLKLYGNLEVVFQDADGRFEEGANINSVFADDDKGIIIVSDFVSKNNFECLPYRFEK